MPQLATLQYSHPTLNLRRPLEHTEKTIDDDRLSAPDQIGELQARATLWLSLPTCQHERKSSQHDLFRYQGTADGLVYRTPKDNQAMYNLPLV